MANITELGMAAWNWGAEKVESGISWAKDQVTGFGQNLVQAGTEALGNLISGVNKVMPSMLPTITACLATLSYRGSQGNFASVSYPIVLTASFLDISGIAPDKFGYPYCKSRPPEDLTGFALAKNSRFHISGTMPEEEALEAFFDRGVILDWSGT